MHSIIFCLALLPNPSRQGGVHCESCLIIHHPRLTDLKNQSMNIENTQSQMRKGVLEFCILSIIQRGEAYPSDMIEEMKRANLNILEGTLYPLLTRLKNADLLSYRWVESSSGPPRKYFSLTEKGAAFYSELEKTWNELANAVAVIAKGNTQEHTETL